VSAVLGVEIETGPIERARADLAIVSFATTDRPLRGAAGRADWRLCGRLSRLIGQGRVEGHAGEAVLLPGGGGLRAPLVLALGLGPGASLGTAAAAAFARDAVARGLALRAATLALALPPGELGDLALRLRLEAIVTGAGEALTARSEVRAARLLLVAAREDGPRLLEALRALRPPGFPPAVSLRLPGAPPRRAAALPASPRSESGIRPTPFK
jgi:Cytosol aminopeptidase family, N-terminal domain